MKYLSLTHSQTHILSNPPPPTGPSVSSPSSVLFLCIHTRLAERVTGDLWEKTEDIEVNANTHISLDRL